MKIDIQTLVKKVQFPKTQAQPSKKIKGFWALMKRGFTFKRMYEITEDYIIWCEYLNAFIFIPKNFMSDNASVPKIFNSFYKSDGILLLGAYPHDFGYKYQGLILIDKEGLLYFKQMTRKKIDMILETLSAWESGMPKSCKFVRKLLIPTGIFAWRNHIKNNNNVANVFTKLF